MDLETKDKTVAGKCTKDISPEIDHALFEKLVSSQREHLSKMDFMADAVEEDIYDEVETDEFGNCVCVVTYGPAGFLDTLPSVAGAERDDQSLDLGDDEYILDDMSMHSSDLEMDHIAFPEDSLFEQGHSSSPNFSPQRSMGHKYFMERAAPGGYWSNQRKFSASYSQSWGPGQWEDGKDVHTFSPSVWRMRDRAPSSDSLSNPNRFARARAQTAENPVDNICDPRKECFQSSFSSQTQAMTASGSSYNTTRSEDRSWPSRKTTENISEHVRILTIEKAEQAERSRGQKTSGSLNAAAV